MSRVAVLAFFSLLSFIVGLTWTTFSNVPQIAGDLFPALANTQTLTWTLNANNLSQLLTAPFALWLLAKPPPGRTGLHVTIVLGALTLLIQSTLWAVATFDPKAPWAVAALIVGGVAGGSASAFTQGCVSQLSAAWFPPKARGTATSVAYASQYAGQAVAFLIALPICSAADLKWLLRVELAVAAALLAMAFAFPDAPVGQYSPEVVDDSLDSTIDARQCQSALIVPLCERDSSSHMAAARSRSASLQCVATVWGLEPGQLSACLVLGLYAAWLNGFYSAWSTTLPLMWGAMSNESAACDGRSSVWDTALAHEGNLLGFAAGVAYPLGGALVGVVADRFFTRKLRQLLLLCMLVALLAFAAVVACRPPPPWLLPSEATDGSSTGGDAPDGGVLLAFLPSVLIGGAAVGGTMPTAMELLAEVGHPIAPGASANAVVGLLQVTAAINTFLAAVLSAEAMNALMLSSILVCSLLLLLVRERYWRSHCEAEADLAGHEGAFDARGAASEACD